MFTISLPFLDSSEIFIHGFLLQHTGAVFEASVQHTDGCDNSLGMSVYPLQDIYLTPETNRINSGDAFCIVSDNHTYHLISEDIHKSVCIFYLNM